MTDKFCGDCGAALTPGLRFCTDCGHEAAGPSAPAKPGPAKLALGEPGRKGSRSGTIVMVCLAGCVAVLLMAILWSAGSGDEGAVNDATSIDTADRTSIASEEAAPQPSSNWPSDHEMINLAMARGADAMAVARACGIGVSGRTLSVSLGRKGIISPNRYPIEITYNIECFAHLFGYDGPVSQGNQTTTARVTFVRDDFGDLRLM